MWLRWVVTNLLSEMAEKKVRQAVDQARQTIERRQPVAAEDGGPVPRAADCSLAMIFATALESGALLGRLQQVVTTRCPSFVEHVGTLDGRRLVAAESGVGAAAARQAAEDVIQLHHPEWIVSAGFAGSLDASLARGHFLLANAIVDADHHELSVPLQIDAQVIESTPGLHVGRLLSVERIIGRQDQKRQLASEYGAVACDMETAAVARVCRESQVKFLSVRVISDGLDDVLPPEIAALVGQETVAAKVGAATRALFQRPASVKDIWRLRDRAQQSAERLARFLAGVVPQLNE